MKSLCLFFSVNLLLNLTLRQNIWLHEMDPPPLSNLVLSRFVRHVAGSCMIVVSKHLNGTSLKRLNIYIGKLLWLKIPKNLETKWQWKGRNYSFISVSFKLLVGFCALQTIVKTTVFTSDMTNLPFTTLEALFKKCS